MYIKQNDQFGVIYTKYIGQLIIKQLKCNNRHKKAYNV